MPDAAWSFYQQPFGWEKTESMDMGPMGTYQMFGWEGKSVGEILKKPSEMPGPPFWLPYAKVDDSRQTAQMFAKLGAKVVSGPNEVPGGDWIAQAVDLQSAMFAVHSAKPVARQQAAAKPKAAAKGTAAPRKSATAKKAPTAKRVKPSARKAVKKAVKKTAKRAVKPSKKSAKRATRRTAARRAVR